MTRRFSVIGILASPRKGGNSDRLLDKALEGAASAGAKVGKIVSNDLDFRPCQECGGCDKTGVCVIKDDMQSVYRKLESADAIIVASPIFFGTVSAQFKMMLDRLQCAWVKKDILKKMPLRGKKRPGLFLCVAAGNREEFFEDAKRLVRIFFSVLGIKYSGDLICPNVVNKGDIGDDGITLEKAFMLGRGLVKHGR